MPFVDGQWEGSNVGRAVARHKHKQAAADAQKSPERGNGKEVTVTKKDDGGYHTKSTNHDGSTAEQDHQSMDQVTQHMSGHFGEAKPMRDKNPKMQEKDDSGVQQNDSMSMPSEGGLSDMGVADGE